MDALIFAFGAVCLMLLASIGMFWYQAYSMQKFHKEMQLSIEKMEKAMLRYFEQKEKILKGDSGLSSHGKESD